MARFDADIGWTETRAMKPCACGHYEKAHRPMSRKCSRCSCEGFHVGEVHREEQQN